MIEAYTSHNCECLSGGGTSPVSEARGSSGIAESHKIVGYLIRILWSDILIIGKANDVGNSLHLPVSVLWFEFVNVVIDRIS